MGYVDAATGIISNISPIEYTLPINLLGSTINPYSNQYLISSGTNLLTFDLGSGVLVNSAPIYGPIETAAFQNYRFNPSDSTIYGMVPENFYSTYYDTLAMMEIEVLDSARIRFAKIDPSAGEYSLIGNTPYKNIYTLAGNSIDPHQMIYYYSAVDTLVGIDLYTGEIFSETPIQLAPNMIFENFTYNCADTTIYGLIRENFIVSVYDTLLGISFEIVDSISIKLSKIEPNSGVLTIISPDNLGLYATLTGSCFIDPNTMTYYFSTGTSIVGVSLDSGLITSTAPITFPSENMNFSMMRSEANCFGAAKMREQTVLGIQSYTSGNFNLGLRPNPAQEAVNVVSTEKLIYVEVYDIYGKRILVSAQSMFDISSLTPGIYLVVGHAASGRSQTSKLIKN